MNLGFDWLRPISVFAFVFPLLFASPDIEACSKSFESSKARSRVSSYVGDTISDFLSVARSLGLKTGVEIEFYSIRSKAPDFLRALAKKFKAPMRAVVYDPAGFEHGGMNIVKEVDLQKFNWTGIPYDEVMFEIKSPTGPLRLDVGNQFFELKLPPLLHSQKGWLREALETLKDVDPDIRGSKEVGNKEGVSIQYNVDVNDVPSVVRLLAEWAANRDSIIEEFRPSPSRLPNPIDLNYVETLASIEPQTYRMILGYVGVQLESGNLFSSDVAPRGLRPAASGRFPALEYRIFDVDFNDIAKMERQWDFCLAVTAKAHSGD